MCRKLLWEVDYVNEIINYILHKLFKFLIVEYVSKGMILTTLLLLL
jgi:hypothetical protein